MLHDGIDTDFDIGSITSFYMDTLGIRDNVISDRDSLGAFLDAVFNLGAVDSFIHRVSADTEGRPTSPTQMFASQVQKYGEYSDVLYGKYLDLKTSWNELTSYLSGERYEY